MYKSTGLSEDQIKGIVTGHTTLEVKVDGDNYTLSSALGTRTYPVGTEVEEKTPDGKVLKVCITIFNIYIFYSEHCSGVSSLGM